MLLHLILMNPLEVVSAKGICCLSCVLHLCVLALKSCFAKCALWGHAAPGAKPSVAHFKLCVIDIFSIIMSIIISLVWLLPVLSNSSL